MELRKWTTSNNELQKALEHVVQFQQDIVGMASTEAPIKALGVTWNPVTDTLQFDPERVVEDAHGLNKRPTKRKLFSLALRVFDPLGLISPVTLVAKIIMQKIWIAKTGWNEPIPANIMTHWETIIKGLSELARVRIPRWIKENTKRLHLFCDASDDAYSVAAYIKVEDKDKIRLLCSKTRVAPDPKKSVSTPRLELLSNLLLARLGEYVEKALNTEFEKILWTDSAIALWWIKGEAGRWKQFVHNRVMEIREKIPTDSVRHCPGLQNPADIASRGASVRQLIDKPDWWEGPTWLKNETRWPKTPTKVEESCIEELQKEQKTVETTHCHIQTTERWYEKYST